jgi:hypothetical protein
LQSITLHAFDFLTGADICRAGFHRRSAGGWPQVPLTVTSPEPSPNRIIGDQQYPDDVEWTSQTGSTAAGQGVAYIPDWVKNKSQRPHPEHKAFYGWRWPHLTADKQLLPSGLLGPVRLVTKGETLVK